MSHNLPVSKTADDIFLNKDSNGSLQQELVEDSQDRNAVDDDQRIRGNGIGSIQAPTDAIPENVCSESYATFFSQKIPVNNFCDGHFSAVFKDKCCCLTVKIKSPRGEGSGSLIHPKIWKHFKDNKNLQQYRIGLQLSSDLAIKVNKELISTDYDASMAIIDLSCRHCTVRINNCSKLWFDIEGCSLLACHNVPLNVCEHLKQTYRDLCDLARYMARGMISAPKKAYLVIGHFKGQKVIYEGLFRAWHEEMYRYPSYVYSSLEESADNFFNRTIGSNEDVMAKIKRICPGDKCPCVVRLPPDRQSCLDISNNNGNI